MKKLSFFLMAMLITFGVTNTSAIAPEDTVLWGENFAHFGTKTPSSAGTGSGTTIYDGASITYTQSSTNTKGYNETLAGGTAPELLLSKSNQTWTISGIKTGGATEMSLTFLSNKTTFSVTVSSANLSVSGSGKEWTISLKDGETDPETFNLTIKNTASSNARIDNVELKVTVAGVESGAETVELPVFSVTEANFTEAFNLTITSAEGTTLKYTLDNSNPKESATAVVVESNTATIAIPAKSTIVRAVAVKGDLVSGVKSMTYCYINSAETAYTVTEALAIYNEGLGLSNKLYIKGSVKSIEELSTEFGNATYTITDGESDLYIYRGKNFGGEKFTSADQLFVNDDLVLYGQLTSYNGNPQVAANSEIISRESKTKSILAEDLTFDAIALGDEVEAQTLTVTGANLTAEIAATLDNEKFTVTPATLPAEGGDLTITPAADLTVGEHTATLTLTSGETVKEVALSILVKDVYSINWSVNGTIANETKVVAGDKLVLPAAPEAPEACSEKVFVGWTAAEEVNADGFKIEWATAATIPTTSATYYAVFAAQEGEGGAAEEGTVTLAYTGTTTSNMDVEANNATIVGLDETKWNVKAAKGDNSNAPGLNKAGDIRLYYADPNSNTITVTSLDETVTISTIVITYTGDDYSNGKILVNDAAVTGTDGTYEINANSFTITNGNTSNVQVRIKNIVINYTTGAAATYTDYSTTCEAEIEWMEMPLEINNLTTEVMEVAGAKYLMMMGGNEEMGESVTLFLNNYADVDDDYEVNAESSLIVYMGYEFTVMEGTISQTSETEKGTLYTGTIYAYTEIEGETMYAVFTLTMYATPVTVLVLTDAIVAINEELGTLTFNIPTGEGEGYYAELANYTAPGVHEGPQICLFESPEVVAFANYVETSVTDGVITLTGEFTSFMGAKIDLTISGTLPVEEPIEKPEPTYTENNLNPYAFGLESVLSEDKTTLTVTYRLNNSNATSVNVIVYNGEEVVATVPGTTTIGKNTVEVPTADLPGGVKLTWAVEVNGTSVEVPTQETKMYNMYCPHGLAIDKDPESEYFGRILVADAMNIVKDKTGYLGSGIGAGLHVFNPSFTTDSVVYKGGNDFTRVWASNGYQPWRVKISEDGRIFVSSLDLNGVVVWEVSKDLQTWTPVIAGTQGENGNILDAEGNFVAGMNVSMDVVGSGENLKLLLYSCTTSASAFSQSAFRLDEYALGTATTWTGTPKNILTGGKYALVHTNAEWIYDGEGGYWFGASRAGNAGQPNLAHINAAGVQDYYTEDASLYGGDGVLVHNGMLFKGKARSSSTVGNFGVWTIGKDAEGNTTLTEKWSVSANGIGRNLNEFAVDYAENLYVVGNSGEKIIAYALPYSGQVETPAASQYAFELDYEKMDVTMTNLEVAEMEGYLVLTASDELNTGLNVMLALNEDGTVSSEMSYATISSGWMETELPILEGTITKTYSEELATDVYSGLVVVLNNGAKFGLNLTMYATPAIDVVIENATITIEEISDGVGGTSELINVSAPWGESMLVIEGIEKNHEGFVQIKEIIIVDGEEDWYIWMCENAVVTTVDNVLTVTGRFKNNYIGVSYNVTISGNLPQGPGTALDNVDVEAKTIKMIKNGQLIIIKNGVQYSVQGQVIK